jgi:Ca-activated chloride channel family protein|tara:strand:+ start:1130 stop:2086 length:957 start_codon:yes stop_codon:yes gene_type:complete
MYLTFTHPAYLWFLLTIPILAFVHFLTLGHNRKRALKFANFEAIARITKREGAYHPLKGPTKNQNISLLIIRTAILVSLILSIAGTILWYEGQSSDFDFVIAIDASASMMADDFSPNRLVASKEAALSFMDALTSKASIGVVSFAGVSIVDQKPTDDMSFVETAIRNIKTNSAGGTDLGQAIITSSNLLGDERNKAVILLTDGQSNVGTAPERGVEYANKNGVTVHTIGVGTAAGGSFLGLNITSRIDEETLEGIALSTGGSYFKAANKTSLFDAYRNIATSEERKLSLDLSVFLLIIAFILLFLEWVLVNSRYRVIP